MNSIIEEKKKIRNIIKLKKSELSEEDLVDRSNKITGQLLTTQAFKEAGTIMCYLSFDAEVDTNAIIAESLRQKKKISIPIIIKEKDGSSRMEASKLLDPLADLAPGILGIKEPRPSAIRIMNPEEIDLIIIPGLAFDKQGNRLGYGAGYYDAFLERIRKDCRQIALTFTIQLIEKVPTDESDKKIPNILTEAGFILKEKDLIY